MLKILFPITLINWCYATFAPRALFVKTYRPSSEVTRDVELAVKNHGNHITYKFKRIYYK